MEREQSETGIDARWEIAPGVYGMEVGKGISRANVYFVQSGSAWVLIDAGLAQCGELIRKTAESLFGANTPPTAILLTHDHPDHAGSVRELVSLWNCPVFVHPDELPLTAIEDLSTVRRYANPLDRWIIIPLLRVMPQRRVESMFLKASLKDVVRAFDPCAAVPGLHELDCIPTPGHTPGHVAFFRNRDRTLITGDDLLTVDLNSLWGFLLWSLRLNKQRVSGTPWYSTWRWQAAKESVSVLAKLEPRVLACGHGAPITGDRAVRELRAFADHLSSPPQKAHRSNDSRS